ncbi:nucleotidyltransferase family protein [Roseobacter litoralis]|uniref:Nucleotidyltransferase n=1 Tax=Roseobacter litoralis (strain ATCC 49566 / DSM 6996 / JCM 21268 / NBRC 15278 / OCh 149) TaxID=391595 RepID=F7ZJ63_ROSLO|nr:nucleotidyltransferase family protein [Roseobacter litoralis]AEI96308.1 putative nucleotidyltransferase [Roseobacter litoralis Och 149]
MKDFLSILAAPEDELQRILKIIDSSALGFVLVVGDGNRLLGTITDGDMRRALLRGEAMSTHAIDLMNPSPRRLQAGATRIEQQNFLVRHRINFAPIVDDAGSVTGVAVSAHLPGNTLDNVAVVVMAGGLGSRLGDLTKHKPKPLLDVDGEPILEKIIKRYRDDGLKDFIFCVNYKAEMIREHFGSGDRLGVKIDYVEEKKRLGTGGALSLIDVAEYDHFFVTNADIMCTTNFRDMLEFHLDQDSDATMAVREYEMQIPFGVVETEGFEIKSLREKPTYKHFINAGYYVLDKSALAHVPRAEFFDMPSLFDVLREKKIRTRIYPTTGDWIDIGRPEDLEHLRRKTKEK